MATFISPFSLRLKLLQGKMQKTSVIEEKRNNLLNEYNRFNELNESDLLIEYRELDSCINSDEFKARKKEIENLKFKGTEEHQKLEEYKKLEKSKPVKQYFNFRDSEERKRYESIKESEKLARYNELKEKVNSAEFKDHKKNYKFVNSQEYKKEQEYLQKKKSTEFKAYFKLINSEMFRVYTELKESDTIPNFEALKSLIESDEFKSNLKQYKKDNSEEYSKFLEYKTKVKDRKIKLYYKFLKHKSYIVFKNIHESEDINTYLLLEKEVSSDEFKSFKKNYVYTNTEEHKLEEEFKALGKDDDLKFLRKMEKSSVLANFNRLHESDTIARYEELKEYVNSDEFKEFKAFRENKKRFTLTEEFKKQERFKELQKNEDIIWFLKTEKHNDFDLLLKWNLVFEDDFNENKLSEKNWLTQYFWSTELNSGAYVLANEKQWYQKENIQINNSILHINLKKEAAQGKVWNPQYGFMPQDFDYTSGMINTARALRMKYGAVEAKLKLSDAFPTRQAFWMVGNKMLPHIDIINKGTKGSSSWNVGNFWQNGNNNVDKNRGFIKGMNLCSDFHIFRLEWTPEKLTWKVNNIIIGEAENGIPNEEMYINFGLSLPAESSKEPQQPASMQIDWVRCFEMNS